MCELVYNNDNDAVVRPGRRNKRRNIGSLVGGLTSPSAHGVVRELITTNGPVTSVLSHESLLSSSFFDWSFFFFDKRRTATSGVLTKRHGSLQSACDHVNRIQRY